MTRTLRTKAEITRIYYGAYFSPLLLAIAASLLVLFISWVAAGGPNNPCIDRGFPGWARWSNQYHDCLIGKSPD